MASSDRETPVKDDPTDELKKYFIGKYLVNAGYTWSSVDKLPEPDRARVMTAASVYADDQIEQVPNKPALLQVLQIA
ncbi:MAG: hypothetical protein M1482_13535 [Chloroflexi bacterium]|nr:hypothetical protein [Chloroflexota bacterium]